MIKSGRDGQILYDAAGTLPIVIASMNKWKLSLKTDKINVTCFEDANKVYVPVLRDISGTLGGFWNIDELTLFEATEADTPGKLELVPNKNEPTFKWAGLAYLDAEIDTSVEGAPAVGGSFMAADSWTQPTGAILGGLAGGGVPAGRGVARGRSQVAVP
jgi:hypothetical protein